MSGVEDWSDCDDPDELRIRLDVALQENAELREELAQVKADNEQLRARLGKTAPTVPVALSPVADPVPVPPATGAGGLPFANAASGTAAKIALFRALFAGREDVYARRWVSVRTGRTGWGPAEDNPFDKKKDEADRVFWQLTDETVYGHLDPARQGRSELHIGLYPLLADDTCRLLACDFDGKDGSDYAGGDRRAARRPSDAGQAGGAPPTRGPAQPARTQGAQRRAAARCRVVISRRRGRAR
jgi:hypothetical protein